MTKAPCGEGTCVCPMSYRRCKQWVILEWRAALAIGVDPHVINDGGWGIPPA